ncbi:hypothetical protein PQX77_015527 [Marasmius sp. AFHP31]|nr:hypothetical protein PQX77_015527 [Marasmius sp. AFHP31]
MKTQASNVDHAPNATQFERLAKQHGIKSSSILMQLPSLSFPSSFPYDFIYLIFENVMQNLVLLWTGAFKGLDEGSGSYHLDPSVWEAIGKATAAAGSSIPSCLGARPPNVADDKQAMTADRWSFWLLYIGPVLVEDKFTGDQYYKHFLKFSTLVRLCLEFEYEEGQVEVTWEGFVEWVEEYKELYYHFSPERSSACPLTVHALLHVADMIEAMGPVWAYWAFPTERYCGRLQPAIRSKWYPFANTDNYLISVSHLSQFKIVHGLERELLLRQDKSDFIKGQFHHPNYPSCILLPPHKPSSTVSNALHSKIMVHLAMRLTSNTHKVTKAMVKKACQPSNVTRWYKVCRLEGSDDMVASSLVAYAEDRQDATFVRYDLLVDINARNHRAALQYAPQHFYGQLQEILVVVFPASQALNMPDETTLILATIERCAVYNANKLGMPVYEKMVVTEVVDIGTVQCLVGRIQERRQWTISRSYYVPGE